MVAALRRHWPEYLIEALALGYFMVAAGLATIALEHPDSPLRMAIDEPLLRRIAIGAAMGVTAVLIIYSPWGRRSGAHMNPAVTLAFWRLGRVRGWDAAFYIAAQILGGTAGILLVAAVAGPGITAVDYVVTVPGADGPWLALLAEAALAFALMLMVLTTTGSRRLMPFTGLFAGLLVWLFIAVEAPLSGMSINPARTLASALPSGIWTALWVYLIAPVAGMQLAALAHAAWRRSPPGACAKLIHDPHTRCIHCGWEPIARENNHA